MMTRYGSIIITASPTEAAELGRELRLAITELVWHIGWHNHWEFGMKGEPAVRTISFAVFDEVWLRAESPQGGERFAPPYASWQPWGMALRQAQDAAKPDDNKDV